MRVETRRPSVRTVLLGVLAAALVALVVLQFTSLQRLSATLESASLPWLVASAVLHVAFFSFYAWMYHFGFEAVEAPLPTRRLVPVVFAAMFAKAIVPIEGAGFAAVLMAESAREGRPPARAAAVALLVSAIDLTTAAPFVLAGVLVLAGRRTLAGYDVAIGGLYCLVIVAFVGALFVGRTRPGILTSILDAVRGGIVRAGGLVGRPPLVDEGWPERNALQFTAAADAAVRHPGSVARAAGVSLLLHVFNIAGLFTVFQVFGHPVGLDVLVATFGLGTAFYVVSITPQGVGSVEGGVALVLEGLGIPAALAIAVTLVYRAMNIWVPVLIGFVAAEQLVAHPPPRPRASEGDGIAGRGAVDRVRHGT